MIALFLVQRKCKNRYINDNVTELVKLVISDSNGEAVGLGTNEGGGTVPWGSVLGWHRKPFGLYMVVTLG